MVEYLRQFSGYTQRGALHAMGAVPIGQTYKGSLLQLAGARMEMGSLAGVGAGKMMRFGMVGALSAGSLALLSGSDESGQAAVTGGFTAAMLGARLPMLNASRMPGAGGTGWGRFLTPGLSIGMSSYFIYKGYEDNGLQGARDALVWDIATNAAVAKFGYKKIHPELAIGASRGAVISRGMLTHAKLFLGAGIGAQVGQAIGDSIGIPGASIAGTFAGAYVGAAPVRFMASHPIIAAGAVVAGGLAATGYGAYEVMKMGYAHQQARKGIQTSGDLAAFMTVGANTMRERAVQAIQKSHMNARSALGQEANFMHYPGKNYFSKYRV